MHLQLKNLIGLAGLALLTSCSSIGQGVTKAIIEKAEQQPTPSSSLCEITGPEFPGLAHGFQATAGGANTTRLVIVHGIGAQELGYSERLQRNLVMRLGLDTVDPTVKTIALQSPPDAKTTPPNVPLGTLRISRFSNAAGAELLTFELTWADLLTDERKAIAFDDFGVSAKARAELNTSLKTLINSFTDPLAYNGSRGDLIRGSMLQALCWLGRGAWSDYPATARESCSWRDTRRNVIQQDDIIISSHSLGSRIAIDSLTTLGALGDSLGNDAKARAGMQALDSLRDKDITLFMLANQLPLLQSGQPAPAVAKQTPLYCGLGAPKIKERWLKSLSVVAFSDPNDILSYTIPQSFTSAYIDSRLCATTTNVVVGVARPVSLAVTSMASPQVAHTAYDNDGRVLTLMTEGLSQAHQPPQGCSWLRFSAEK
ncbi:MAG: hypothetical protein K2P94_19000 [Rhodospirillaceae bacterium]|nr:hypothetical protein [Rhodospirillaceae bacterium]